MGTRLVRALATVAGLGLAIHACYSPTQVTVEVMTDLPCAGTQGTTITTGPGGAAGGGASAVATVCADQSYGSLVIVPSGARDERILVTVVTGVSKPAEMCVPPYAGCIVARRSLRFVKHAALRLPVLMRSSCVGIPCDDETTCVAGVCVSATIDDPSRCARAGCSEDDLPQGPPNDAGTAPIDGGADAAADGPIADAQSDGPVLPCACQPIFCGCGGCDPTKIICTKTPKQCPLGCLGSCEDLSPYHCACVEDRCVLDPPPPSGMIPCNTTLDCPPGNCCQGAGKLTRGACAPGNTCN